MDFGVHLPLADLGEGTLTSTQLQEYTGAAADLGYATLAANDHLVWHRPWLDGPTALTSVLAHAGAMTVASTIALPVVRHPVVVAKWLATLGCLTGNRIIAGLGPGSSSDDYAAVGVEFAQRWGRFDEALMAVKALLRGERAPAGRFYDVSDVELAPLPAQPPEVWVGSWGSDVRLRAMAALADGWVASGYNTTPSRFARARARLEDELRSAGRDPSSFGSMVATVWLYVTDDAKDAGRLLREVLAPLLRRDPEQLAEQLPVGPPDHCLEVLAAYASAGAQQVLLWPVREPIRQLHRFAEQVRGQLE